MGKCDLVGWGVGDWEAQRSRELMRGRGGIEGWDDRGDG